MSDAFGPIDLHNMFPVPLLMARLADSASLDTRLFAEACVRRETEAGMDRSNRYGWHSKADFFSRKEPAHRELAGIVREFIDQSCGRSMPERPKRLRLKYDGWVNLNPTHAMNAPHDHAGAFWSGTYYALVPLPDDPEDKLSGAIEFIDPRGSLGSNVQIDTPFTKPKFTVRPAPGPLMLWPAYLKHWVHPNQASSDRLTVSFNAWFTRTG